MKQDHETRQARAEMDAARAQAEKKAYTGPRRYKLYDKIKDRVSLRTIDTVIAVTALLIVALLIYGIATASPQ